jgi:hypothetical protein
VRLDEIITFLNSLSSGDKDFSLIFDPPFLNKKFYSSLKLFAFAITLILPPLPLPPLAQKRKALHHVGCRIKP